MTEVDPFVHEEDFDYAIEIHGPYGALDQVLEWTQQSVNSQWAWRLISASNRATDGRYCFYFVDESDAALFALRWR